MNNPDCTILQAACATIASLEVYEPVIIGDEEGQSLYIDAMTGYANPTNEALKEAERLFGNDTIVSNIVSVGSGKPELRQQQDACTRNRLSDILKQAINDTERVHNDIHHRFQDLGIYFRFNVEGIPPMNTSTGRITRMQTVAYLENMDNNLRMDRAVKSLQERKGIKALKELSTICALCIGNQT
jgi:hypothetical protein